MNKSVVEVRVRALVPTGTGCAVFLGNEEKVFVIYVDPSVGSAIGMFINRQEKERPLTHDLMALVLEAVGAKVERVIINDLKNGTYFGRLIITAENEIHQKKIVELDARPSDCIAMAAQQHAPIYVCEEVWNEVEDMGDVLEKIEESRESDSPSDEGTDD